MPPITYNQSRYPTPNQLPPHPLMGSFEADAHPDSYRFAPHRVVLDTVSRVTQAMAANLDPLPAYMALHSLITGFTVEDAYFHQWEQAVDARCDVIFRAVGQMDRIVWVAWHIPPLIDLAHRQGIIVLEPARAAVARTRTSIERRDPTGRRGLPNEAFASILQGDAA